MRSSAGSSLAQGVGLNNLARVARAVSALGDRTGVVNLNGVALAREQELDVAVLLLDLSVSKLLALELDLSGVGLGCEQLRDGAVSIVAVVGNKATEATHNGDPLHVVGKRLLRTIVNTVCVPFSDNLAGFRGRPGDSQHGIIMARFWLADKLTH